MALAFCWSLLYFAGVSRGSVFLVVATALAIALAAAPEAQAAPGDLDTSFGQAGMATIVLPHNAFGNAMIVQPDGSIVVAGTAVSANGQTSDVVSARFTPQGAPDTSYGVAGTGASQADFGANETGYAAALQTDGKIVVAGDRDADRGMERVLVTRFNANGTLDTSFGQGKGWVSPYDGSDFPDMFGRAIAVRAGGQIVVGGYIDYSPDVPVIEQLTTDGQLDGSFAPDGTVMSPGEGAQPGFETLAGIALAADGSIEAVGETSASASSPLGVAGNFAISNITGNSFGSISQDLGGTDVATAVAVQPDGKFIVAGYTDVSGTDNFAVTRYTSNQVLDTSFGNGGTETVDLGGNDFARAVAIQPNGKIVVAGTTQSGSATRIGVIRLLPTGQPDTAFGRNGVSVIAVGTAAEAYAVGLQSNGDIVVAGTINPAGSTQNLLVVRLDGDPTSNAGGGSNGGGSNPSPGGPSAPGLPTLSGLTAAKTRFHEGKALPKLNPAGNPGGLVLAVSLSEAAKITLRFLAPAPGRVVKGHCSAPSKRNKGARRCTRHTLAGFLSFQANAGPNKVAFDGRISRTKKLKPGTYTVAITASAANGNSAASKLAITILP